MLLLAAAILCDTASLRLAGEPPPSPAADATATAQVVRAARCVVDALESAAPIELAAAYAYFLAPPWMRDLAAKRPLLTDLTLTVTRFMIEFALDRAADGSA
jgi:hypothetical protein